MIFTFFTFLFWSTEVLILLWTLMFTLPNKFGLRYYSVVICMAYSALYFLIPLLTAFTISPYFYKKTRSHSNVLLSKWIGDTIMSMLNVKMERRNTHYPRRQTSGVNITNHQSIIDTAVLLNAVEDIGQFMSTSKSYIKWIVPINLLVYFCGGIFLDKRGGKAAGMSITKAAQKLIDSGVQVRVQIYPEGTRTMNSKELKPFKKGAFLTAIQLQLPIFPMVISEYYFINDKKRIFGYEGKIITSFLEPIETKGLTEADADELIKKTHDLMQAEYSKINAELRATEYSAENSE